MSDTFTSLSVEIRYRIYELLFAGKELSWTEEADEENELLYLHTPCLETVSGRKRTHLLSNYSAGHHQADPQALSSLHTCYRCPASPERCPVSTIGTLDCPKLALWSSTRNRSYAQPQKVHIHLL